MAADGEEATAGVEGGCGGGRGEEERVKLVPKGLTEPELRAMLEELLEELAVGDKVTIKITKASQGGEEERVGVKATAAHQVAQREDLEMKSLRGAGPRAAPPRPRPRPPYSSFSAPTPTPVQRRVAGVGRPHPVPRAAPLPRPPCSAGAPCRPPCCAAPPPPCSPVQRRPATPRAPLCSAAPPPPRPPYSCCSTPTPTPVQRSSAPGHPATRDVRPLPPATRRREAPAIRRRTSIASRQRRASAHLTTPATTTQLPPIPLPKPSPARDGRVDGTDRRVDEEAMLRRRRRGGGGHGYMEQDHPPATGHRPRRREEEAPSHLPPPQEQQPSASLPDDVLFEILSRVPYRSLCRFRCVSKPWLALCSDPDVRRRSPQTLSGFFYYGSDDLCFHNLSGRGPPLVDPSLPFLRGSYECFFVEACCSSLLLCRCWRLGSQVDEYDYVVCNPATEEWTALPPIELLDQEDGHLLDFDEATYYLGFDAAVPSRFVVFVPLYTGDDNFEEVATYSSETGRWTSMQSQWFYNIGGTSGFVFLNGNMHLTTHYSSIVTVEEEGKSWREMIIDGMPYSLRDCAGIGQSQGRLYAWHVDNLNDCKLSIWVLEDYISGQWTLKHTANVLELFGRHCRKADDSYEVFAIHPDCNLIFISEGNEKTVSYDMDNCKVHVICTDGEFVGGLPYIPCFVEWSSDGH